MIPFISLFLDGSCWECCLSEPSSSTVRKYSPECMPQVVFRLLFACCVSVGCLLIFFPRATEFHLSSILAATTDFYNSLVLSRTQQIQLLSLPSPMLWGFCSSWSPCVLVCLLPFSTATSPSDDNSQVPFLFQAMFLHFLPWSM